MLESNNHVERWSGTVHRVYLCVCVCVLRVFSTRATIEIGERPRITCRNTVVARRDTTDSYAHPKLSGSWRTARTCRSAGHCACSYEGSRLCYRQLSSIRGGGRWEKRAHDRGKVVEMSCELRFPHGPKGWVLFPMDCCFEFVFSIRFDVSCTTKFQDIRMRRFLGEG